MVLPSRGAAGRTAAATAVAALVELVCNALTCSVRGLCPIDGEFFGDTEPKIRGYAHGRTKQHKTKETKKSVVSPKGEALKTIGRFI